MLKHTVTFLICFGFINTYATIWQVGPTRTYTYCSQVAPLVQDGDTVEIDFAVYVNDPQVQWNKDNLYLAGVGGRPRLEAGSIIANDSVNGKGIFVISGDNVKVENIEFALSAVQDHNGAGIRQEGAGLHVIHCRFDSNEMGILAGNIPDCTTTIEFCEFVNGGSLANPGYQHNIYINHIDSLIFRFNYSHDAIAEGHELKSRANYNFIICNRIANELSVDSRTVDLPNGGTCVMVGNVIEQGVNSANSNLMGYGLEGLTNSAPHRVWICSNTFINKKPTGSFIHVAGGTDSLYVKNNILAGAHTGGIIIGSPSVLDSSHNLVDQSISNPGFVNPAGYDYHLQANSVARDAGLALTASVLGYPLQPQFMYVDTCGFEPRSPYGAMDIGAFEFTLPSAIPETGEEPAFLFPNPCDDMAWIAGTENAGYAVFDLSGKRLLTGIGDSINTSALTPGVYLLRLGTRRTLFMKR